MTNVWYVKNILANCDGNMYLPILHLPKVELHCKLQEKLHRVSGPLDGEMSNERRFLKKGFALLPWSAEIYKMKILYFKQQMKLCFCLDYIPYKIGKKNSSAYTFEYIYSVRILKFELV